MTAVNPSPADAPIAPPLPAGVVDAAFAPATSSMADAPSGDKIPMQVLPHSAWDRFEMLLERAGEFLNPILVKEARQALKSKQFVITFTLVLICGWGWSLLGIAIMTMSSQDVFYTPSGPFMLLGYHWVLAFPLILIVPFAAFRSLASEREDGTYELLSITTLLPRQIIGGKFGSAVLQMMVYLSALAPCVAFTYLLRGIDIISILMFVSYTLVASLLMSMVGLLVATVSKAKHWQIVLSVVMILGLAVFYGWGSMLVTIALMEGETMPIDMPEFWVGHLAMLTTLASFFVLLYLSAAARISFASDNRSTRLRIMMVVQQALLTGWIMYYALTYKDGGEVILVTYFVLSALYWAFTGSLMCGENPQLSQRVQRSLPQSLLGRTLLTWLNPGPGAGYMFTVCNLLMVLLVGTLAGLQIKSELSPTAYDPNMKGPWGMLLYLFHSVDPREIGFAGRIRIFLGSLDFSDEWLLFGILAVSYVVCYLGLTRLIVLLTRQAARVGLFVSFLLLVVLVLLGSLVPFVVQVATPPYDNDYTALQVTSPLWTLIETLDGDLLQHTATFLWWTFPVVPVTVVAAACLIFMVNLFVSSTEAAVERQAAPQRVVEDELALHPERADRPVRLSPWDDEPSASPFAK